jgi:hypothetical protein
MGLIGGRVRDRRLARKLDSLAVDYLVAGDKPDLILACVSLLSNSGAGRHGEMLGH